MAGQGLRPFFQDAQEDAAQIIEGTGTSVGNVIGQTGRNATDGIDRVMETEATNTENITAAGAQDVEGGLPRAAESTGPATENEGVDGGENGEPPQEEESGSSLPDWLREKFEAGRKFNEDNWPRYPHNEVHLKSGKIVDSYRPAREIVERKNSQLAGVQESTANGYIDSLRNKYDSGQPIGDTPKNRAEGIAGQTLRGRPILEVPPQERPVPANVLAHAKKRGVIIRDTSGRVYR